MASPYRLGSVPVLKGKSGPRRHGPILLLLAGLALLMLGSTIGSGLGATSSLAAAVTGALPGAFLDTRPSAAPRLAVSPGGLITGPAPAWTDPALAALLDGAAARYQGSLGVVVRHLGSGAMATLNTGQRFRSASLYKLFVLHSAFARLQGGELARDEMLTLSPEAFDADPYAEWPAGTRVSVADALHAMIAVSSNAATDMLIERLGGTERINTEMKALGLQGSAVGNDYAYTTADDIALLLETIVTGRGVSAEASREMLKLLKDQRRNDRLPLPLPLEVEVAHKTGELTRLRNDAGVVYAPSGPYLFVALADGARNDAAARQVILDLSHDVYAYLEPGGLTRYLGLPPRLALEVFRTLDSRGRLAPLEDEWSQTVSVTPAGVALAEGVKSVALREMAVPDLLALQRAAEQAGASFWVGSGYRAPRGSDGPLVLKDATTLPIRVELPPKKTPASPTPPPAVPKAPPPPPAASQQWLGTVVGVSDSRDGGPTTPDYSASAAGRWLVAHAWEFGFVLTPAESQEGRALGYEPWKLRWVGIEMAKRLHDLGYERDPSAVVPSELRRAQEEIADRASSQGTRVDPVSSFAGFHQLAALVETEETVAPWEEPYRIVADQILGALRDYEQIPMAVPAAVRRGDPEVASVRERGVVHVRTPYWINDAEGEARQARAVAEAPDTLQKLFRRLPAAVRQAKGTPDQIRAALEAVLETPLIQGPDGGWPPGPSDIEQWMRRFGIGVDCSGFVYEALTRMDRALVASGQAGLARPLDRPPTYLGSEAIARGGDPVGNPGDLRPGDVMYRPPHPDKPTRHIRILHSVQRRGQWMMFETAESSEVDDGPATRWWRFPDAPGFADLEVYADGRWSPAEPWEQQTIYARRLPALGFASATASRPRPGLM